VIRPDRRHLDARRGNTTLGAITLLAAFGTLVGVALVIRPGQLHADTPSTRVARDPDHNRSIELVAGMVVRSRAVLALHDGSEGPFEEVVLWVEDRVNPGVIDLHEVAVLTHSPVLQTLTYYGRSAGDSDAHFRSDGEFDRAFCQVWRTSPSINAGLIGAGLSDVDFAIDSLFQAGRPALRISFTWVSESTDSPDEASVLIDAVMHAQDNGAGDDTP
jgi:hypothetical protein